MDTVTDEMDIIQVDTVNMEYNPVAVFLSSKGLLTRYTYWLDLIEISSIILGSPDPFACPWEALRFQHTQAIRTVLIETISKHTGKLRAPETINRILYVLRGILKTTWRLGLMDAEDYYRAADIENVRGETLPAGRGLFDGEVAALLKVCADDPSMAGFRDAAIISLMVSCGLRRNEVVSLDLIDYDITNDQMVVNGKGNKQRLAYVLNETADAMLDWLIVRGEEPGPMFLPINRADKLMNRRLSGHTIYDMLLRRGIEAGIGEFSPHDLRRTFISCMLGAGIDLVTVSKLAGHASVTTTARYDRRPEEAKRKAIASIHVPYKGRYIELVDEGG
jgi:integrase/recombinase XerD